MSYDNPHATGTKALAESGNYSVMTHGDIGAFYNAVTNSDLPSYTKMFYVSSEAEQISHIKYDRIEIKYDKGMRDMSQSFKGAPIEAYIPKSMLVPDGNGKGVTQVESKIVPKKEIADEILKAQAEILKKKPRIKITEINQEFHFKRRLRKIEIEK